MSPKFLSRLIGTTLVLGMLALGSLVGHLTLGQQATPADAVVTDTDTATCTLCIAPGGGSGSGGGGNVPQPGPGLLSVTGGTGGGGR